MRLHVFVDTVDGKNPAPVLGCKKPFKSCAKLLQDFFHQQCVFNLTCQGLHYQPSRSEHSFIFFAHATSMLLISYYKGLSVKPTGLSTVS